MADLELKSDLKSEVNSNLPLDAAAEPAVEPVATPASKFRWQCRRGMLELDILLNNFIDSLSDSDTEQLTPQQQQTFELLLSYPDQTLFDLLMANSMSSDGKISAIVKLIRSTSSIGSFKY